ncbi:MAG: hypothetical protein OXI34_02755 [Chloroflexota bacterium]|nr:hypothetical protein [Chloroflexota bacterium]MDE2854435.1 hypothetical protein [Chloroflexota bacterium]MDE2946141.1 hypothetical protein [Chloroflexota bacterium]
MPRSKVELKIPSDIEELARRISEQENCSLESVLEDGLAMLFSKSSDAEQFLDRLAYFSDEQLWNLVHLRLTFAQDRRIRDLMERGSENMLSHAEESELESLLRLVDRQTVLRSHALVQLQERGYATLQYVNVELVAE